MSNTPTVSRNDTATAGSISNYQQQQQQPQGMPLQQRPTLTPQQHTNSVPSSQSPLRRQYSNPISDSSKSNYSSDISPVDYHNNTTNNNNDLSGVTNNANGYGNFHNSDAMLRIGTGDSTLDRQRSVQTHNQHQHQQQQAMISSQHQKLAQQQQQQQQLSLSPQRRLSGIPPSLSSYGVSGHSSQTNNSAGGMSTSSLLSHHSPSNNNTTSITGSQPQLPSPQQQMMNIQSNQHNHQMMIQQQQQMQQQKQQQQHQYQPLMNQSQQQPLHRESSTSSITNNVAGNNNISSHKQLLGDSRNITVPQHHEQHINRNSDNDRINISGTSNAQYQNSATDGTSMPIIPSQPGSPLKVGTTSGTPNSSSNKAKLNSSKCTSNTTSSNKMTTSNSKLNNNDIPANSATANSSTTAAASTPQLPPEKIAALLSRCSWVDKSIWASRQLLGGQAVNGFMRSTATVQRIKKQRARQNIKSGKSKVTSSSNNNNNTTATTASDNVTGDTTSSVTPTSSLEEQQAEEEILKTEIMNARTAKKIRQELDGGIQFCVLLHDTIRSIIQQMDPSLPQIEPLSSSPFANRPGSTKATPNVSAIPPIPSMSIQNGTASISKNPKVAAVSSANNASATSKSPSGHSLQASSSHTHTSAISTSSHATPHNATGSQLRRHRRAKPPPSGEILLQLPEIDEMTGKKSNTKKDQPNRLSDVIRFRALRHGDPVAARVTSRDLWILARVVKDYPGSNLSPSEFLRLSDSRREQLFKEKVLIQDVEEHDGGAAAAVLVARNLVLPLPRNVAEAAEWGNFYRFYKKGSRVYAMYPQTTALYTATVVDCTTYCRREDDIIVVEFDGDDPDPITGKLPACHIPARFVTLIPKEFPGAQAPNVAATTGAGNSSTSSSSNSKRKRSEPVINPMDADIMNGVLDDLNFDGDLPGLDQFDDLDFDLLGDG